MAARYIDSDMARLAEDMDDLDRLRYKHKSI